MIYQDNEYKFVVVLNSKIEIGKLFNALGHIIAGLISLCNAEDLRFLKYIDADQGVHPAISHFPFIILKAKNGNQIRTLRSGAIEQDLRYNDFVDKMLGFSAENQLQQTRETREIDLEYYAIALFGRADKINQLTRKFSLF